MDPIKESENQMKKHLEEKQQLSEAESVEKQRPQKSPGWIDKAISAVNGVVGDYLKEKNNGLEIQMAFYHENQPLCLEKASLKKMFPRATQKICVLVHGLACTESIWQFSTVDGTHLTYGSLLQEDLGFTPFYLRYNTGLHISDNGGFFADLMQSLVESYPKKVREIILIGHSMGGLVIRSACRVGKERQQPWIDRVGRAIYIGSPHSGAPLEKIGNIASYILHGINEPYTRLAGNVINLRSSGIKDLRYANVAKHDWHGFDPDELLKSRKTKTPLEHHIAHYFVAGAIMKDEKNWISSIIGDSLVGLSSAKGQAETENSPVFPDGNVRVFPGFHHNRLAYDPDVYQQIRHWCA